MDVVVTWTGECACQLQEALRDTNEAFAARLGIGLRTVATWHKSPELVPRTEMRQLLDQALEQAPPAAQKRFALLIAEPSSQAAQALRVAVAVVVRGSEVLLVCRRDDESAGIRWQFPAGVIKPGGSPASAAVRETLAETESTARCAKTSAAGSTPPRECGASTTWPSTWRAKLRTRT